VLHQRFRVLRYDHRGHGGSPAPAGPYRIDDLADDVLELLDSLGLARVSYCGVSMGGMVGMWLAGHAPERIERLVLCCTAATFASFQPWVDRAAAVRSSGTGSIAPAAVGRWFTPEFRERLPEVVASFEAGLSEVDDEGYAACCDALAALDLRSVLPAIEAPTVVISGADDEATPMECGRLIAEAIPGAAYRVVAGAHLANVESHEEVSAILEAHL
jgi:3-oxoadipate enol-lactonase